MAEGPGKKAKEKAAGTKLISVGGRTPPTTAKKPALTFAGRAEDLWRDSFARVGFGGKDPLAAQTYGMWRGSKGFIRKKLGRESDARNLPSAYYLP